MSLKKIAIIHNTIAPYRHPLFESLSKDFDLIVYYCSVRATLHKWDLWPRNYNYKYSILPRIFLRTPIGNISINLSIIKKLILNKPHSIVLSTYTDLTTWIAFVMARLLRIPAIYWTEGIKEPTSLIGKISRPIRTIFIRNSNSIIVPGRLSKNYVLSLGADPKKVFTAPNAIDNELFIQIQNKSKDGLFDLKSQLGFEGKIMVLYVGQLIERKGVTYLLSAYAKIKKEYPNLAFLVLGNGPLESKLQKIAISKELHDFRIIPSGLNLKELIRLYSIADLFVLPTLEDVWGFVINEAMACGLPVVSTYASQAAIDMIDSGKNGFIVKPMSSEELYFAIKFLLCNPKLRAKMGDMSKEKVSTEFSVIQMKNGFISAIEHSLR